MNMEVQCTTFLPAMKMRPRLNEKDMKIVVFTAGVQHRRVHGLSCGDHKQSVRPTLLYSIFSPKSKSHQPEKIVIVSNQVPTMFLKKCSNVFLKKWCASDSTTRNTGALTQDNITWLEKVFHRYPQYRIYPHALPITGVP